MTCGAPNVISLEFTVPIEEATRLDRGQWIWDVIELPYVCTASLSGWPGSQGWLHIDVRSKADAAKVRRFITRRRIPAEEEVTA